MQACYFHIRALRHIRASLSTEASKTIAAAIVDSRLDFCNSLLAGTSLSNLARLQRVQNTLARVVTQKPVLSDLHWLPVRHRISFKSLRLPTGCYNFSSHPILLLSSRDMYRCEHSAPLHLCQYVFPCVKPPWQPPNHFHLFLPGIWNARPNHLSSIPTLPVFRRALKHHLFLLAYPDSCAKFGMIKPAQCISFRDTVPTTAIAQPVNTMLPI